MVACYSFCMLVLHWCIFAYVTLRSDKLLKCEPGYEIAIRSSTGRCSAVKNCYHRPRSRTEIANTRFFVASSTPM